MAVNRSLSQIIKQTVSPSPTTTSGRTSTVTTKVTAVDLQTVRVSQGGSILGISNVPIQGNTINEVNVGDTVELRTSQGKVYAVLVRPSTSAAIIAAIASTLPAVNTQTIGNSAGIETDLAGNNLAANVLSRNGEAVEFWATGTFAATGSTDKQIRVRFGSALILDTGALAITAAKDWVLQGSVVRTGATTQKCRVMITTSSSVLVATADYAIATENLSLAVLLRVTGQGTNASDVVGEIWQAKFVPIQ